MNERKIPIDSSVDASNAKAPFYFGIIIAVLVPAISYVYALQAKFYGAFFARESVPGFAALAVLLVAAVVLVLSLLMKRWMPPKTSAWISSFCAGLLAASSVLLVVIFIVVRL